MQDQNVSPEKFGVLVSLFEKFNEAALKVRFRDEARTQAEKNAFSSLFSVRRHLDRIIHNAKEGKNLDIPPARIAAVWFAVERSHEQIREPKSVGIGGVPHPIPNAWRTDKVTPDLIERKYAEFLRLKTKVISPAGVPLVESPGPVFFAFHGTCRDLVATLENAEKEKGANIDFIQISNIREAVDSAQKAFPK